MPQGRPPSGRRTELVHIAQQVVARTGLAELTLNDVAEQAGLTAPALYTHFANRLDLVEQVLEATAQEYVEDMARTDDPEAPASERLRVRLNRWSETPTAHLRILQDAVLQMPSSPRIAAAVLHAQEAWTVYVREVLATGVERGQVRADVDVDATTELLTATLFGIEAAHQSGLTSRPLTELSAGLVDLFAAYLEPKSS